MIQTTAGLPNSCSQCGTPVATSSFWFAPNEDGARAGAGVCQACTLAENPNPEVDLPLEDVPGIGHTFALYLMQGGVDTPEKLLEHTVEEIGDILAKASGKKMNAGRAGRIHQSAREYVDGLQLQSDE